MILNDNYKFSVKSILELYCDLLSPVLVGTFKLFV